MLLRRVITDEQLIGVLAFPIPLDAINKLTADPTGMGETGEVFFMGSDLKLRSQSRFKSSDNILSESITIPAVELYQNEDFLKVLEYNDSNEDILYTTCTKLPVLDELGNGGIFCRSKVFLKPAVLFRSRFCKVDIQGYLFGICS